MSVVLNPAELAVTRAKIEKLNSRAIARGWTGRLELHAEQITRDNCIMFDVSITGERPCYDGWEFLASAEYVPAADDDGNWILRHSPGVDDSAIDRAGLLPNYCGHCKTNRARTKFYIVRNSETGEYVQVGSTCIKDFLGWSKSPIFIDSDESILESAAGSIAGSWYPLGYVVTVAIATTKAMGGFKPAGFGDDSTSHNAGLVIHGIPSYLKDQRRVEAIRTVEAIESELKSAAAEAPAVIARVSDEFKTAASGYGANLYAVIASDTVGPQHFGLAVSIVAAYDRIVNGEKRETAKATLPEPQWLGTVGEQIEFSGTVNTIMTVDGYAYGTYQLLVVATDDQNNSVKFYSTAKWLDDVSKGDQINITATVKRHSHYNDKRQTIITRAKPIK